MKTRTTTTTRKSKVLSFDEKQKLAQEYSDWISGVHGITPPSPAKKSFVTWVNQRKECFIEMQEYWFRQGPKFREVVIRAKPFIERIYREGGWNGYENSADLQDFMASLLADYPSVIRRTCLTCGRKVCDMQTGTYDPINCKDWKPVKKGKKT